jgi:formate-dependent nitrite reductase cytochrome c552 subunit
MEDIATAFAEARSEVREAARTHKRSAAAHRRSSRELMQALERFDQKWAKFVAVCAEHGIDVQIEIVEETKPEEAQSDGRPESS